jgi:hypothetical protein
VKAFQGCKRKIKSQEAFSRKLKNPKTTLIWKMIHKTL